MNLAFMLFLFDRYAANNVPTEQQIQLAFNDFNKVSIKNYDLNDLDRGY
jgi:hypothetical protein